MTACLMDLRLYKGGGGGVDRGLIGSVCLQTEEEQEGEGERESREETQKKNRAREIDR